MAFTVTTLSWAAIFYKTQLQATGELENVLSGIKWGTDYFLKASARKGRLYVQVGIYMNWYLKFEQKYFMVINLCCYIFMIIIQGGRP